MDVTRFDDSSAYQAPRHHGCSSFRLQGLQTTPTKDFWVGVSHFLPGGGADLDASPTAKVYLVLAGEITVEAGGERVVLKAYDSCHIPAHEERIVINESRLPASMAVIISTHQEAK